MSCDGYHTTVEPADLPFQGSSMRAVQCKLGRYGSRLERQSSYLPHVPRAPLTDAPPLAPSTPRTLIPPTQWLSPCSWSAIRRFFYLILNGGYANANGLQLMA